MSDVPRKETTVFVAGATGMVGSALARHLGRKGYALLKGPTPRVDLTNQQATLDLLKELKPDWLFLAAAKVGGIHANATYPADFIYNNLMIQTNVLHAAHLAGVKKLLFLGSSCIYPKFAPQPMKEEELLSGYLEPTNEPYAIAKIAGIIMAKSYNRQYGTNYVSVMPSNLYGPNDNFDLEHSHVIPALLRKTHEAKVARADSIEIWGTGAPLREFLHVEDLADACVFLMENYSSSEPVNIGAGTDLSIRELALLIKDVVGYDGEIHFNPDKPDGTPRKLLDVSRIKSLGWRPSIPLREGLESTYRWYVENESRLRK
ncbi:MAG: GDP-L-fucose synthase [Desulfomonile tiedjei]|nr:GDP-L-fucose synthase [Desulfomonile tiedjei]